MWSGTIAQASGSEPTDLLALVLLALAIVSAVIGFSSVPTLLRLRRATFPSVSRRRVRRRLIVLWVHVAVLSVVLPAAGAVGVFGINGFGTDQVARATLLIGLVGVLLAMNYLGATTTRALTRLATEPTVGGERIAAPSVGGASRTGASLRGSRLRQLRENAITGVSLLGLSVLIWYGIDRQLTASEVFNVGVEVELGGLGEEWTLVELDPSSLELTLEGPKEQVAQLPPDGIVARLRVEPDQLRETDRRISLSVPISQLQFESPSGRIPETVRPIAGQPTPTRRGVGAGAGSPAGNGSGFPEGEEPVVTFTLARTNFESKTITRSQVISAVIGLRTNTEIRVDTITPDTIYILYPEQPNGEPVGFDLETIEFSQIVERAVDRTTTAQLSLLEPTTSSSVRFFRDERRSDPISAINVTFRIAPTPEARTVQSVPVRYSIPADLVQRGVTIDPQQVELRRDIEIRGPADEIGARISRGLRLKVVLNENGINRVELEETGQALVPGNRYVLTDTEGRPLGPGYELVEPVGTRALKLLAPTPTEQQ